MRFRTFTDTFDKNPWFFILALFCTKDSGTVLYATVLILTDGVRIYCGNTSESKRIASSAPALFILVKYKIQGLPALYNTARTVSPRGGVTILLVAAKQEGQKRKPIPIKQQATVRYRSRRPGTQDPHRVSLL